MKVSVRVQPRAPKEEVVENTGGSLRVYLRQAPADGKANKALIEILAQHYGMKKTEVRILTGERTKNKIVEIANK